MDPYRVLYVHPRAPQPVIRAAYHALARLYHPDLSDDPASEALMAELNLAYGLVGSPAARAAWARQHNAGEAHATAITPPPPSAQPRRPSGLQETIRQRGTESGAGPLGDRSGSPTAGPQPVIMDYGRYVGWRLEEIARTDRDYLLWLGRSPAGRRYRTEIERVLGAAG